MKFTDFKHFLFSNINILCYKFSSKHSFSYIPQILICCYHFYFVQNIFYFSSLTDGLFRSMGVVVFFKVSNIWGVSRYFSVYIHFNSALLCSDNILCMSSVLLYLLKFVLWPNELFVLVNVSCAICKECIFCCYWIAFSIIN